MKTVGNWPISFKFFLLIDNSVKGYNIYFLVVTPGSQKSMVIIEKNKYFAPE